MRGARAVAREGAAARARRRPPGGAAGVAAGVARRGIARRAVLGRRARVRARVRDEAPDDAAPARLAAAAAFVAEHLLHALVEHLAEPAKQRRRRAPQVAQTAQPAQAAARVPAQPVLRLARELREQRHVERAVARARARQEIPTAQRLGDALNERQRLARRARLRQEAGVVHLVRLERGEARVSRFAARGGPADGALEEQRGLDRARVGVVRARRVRVVGAQQAQARRRVERRGRDAGQRERGVRVRESVRGTRVRRLRRDPAGIREVAGRREERVAERGHDPPRILRRERRIGKEHRQVLAPARKQRARVVGAHFAFN